MIETGRTGKISEKEEEGDSDEVVVRFIVAPLINLAIALEKVGNIGEASERYDLALRYAEEKVC